MRNFETTRNERHTRRGDGAIRSQTTSRCCNMHLVCIKAGERLESASISLTIVGMWVLFVGRPRRGGNRTSPLQKLQIKGGHSAVLFCSGLFQLLELRILRFRFQTLGTTHPFDRTLPSQHPRPVWVGGAGGASEPAAVASSMPLVANSCAPPDASLSVSPSACECHCEFVSVGA